MMYDYGLDHGYLGEQILVLTDYPLMCEGQELIVWSIDIIGSWENGDNSGEDCRGVESRCSNYDGFWFVLLLKNG